MPSLSKPAFSLAGIQWLFFMVVNTVVVPLSIGLAFGLTDAETAGLIRTSFIVVGAASLLQSLIGHRYPLLEGHGGIWWGLVLSLCASAPAMGLSYSELGGSLAVGMLLAGIVTIILGAIGFTELLQKIFNPIVLVIYLFLLSCQLILYFFKGMMGIGDGGAINLPVALLSVIIVVAVLVMSMMGRGSIANFSILIGMLGGWVAFVLFFGNETTPTSGGTLFKLLPLGELKLHIGIIVTAFIAGLINMANSLVAISTVESLFEERTTLKQYQASYYVTGVGTIVAGLFGLIPFGPYSSSIGFLQSTRIFQRGPFILGSALFIVLGLIPALGGFFSTMPETVGDSVLFVAYLQLFSTAIRNVRRLPLDNISMHRITIPMLVGLSILNVPPETFSAFPVMLQPLISNGLLVGVLLSVIMELASRNKLKELTQ
ncbi:uracil/xanthine transporter [Sporosarcina aquimarina]|uniref:Uracil/xanthine transporter n=1 Tax=Sporosarcina aquimarina TaxID=114975 RepID=A0ABU4FVP1_9BACL|nr:uracil/xanthine transporter [Sporosarcina aquimarina]MDW0108768.1 uracil/xanthine transporter [Sporosarcina aquimarina]